MKRDTSTLYDWHKIALAPILAKHPQDGVVPAIPADERAFAQFLVQQRLHGIWLELLERQSHGQHDILSAHLRNFARLFTARELPQQRVLQEIAELFSKNDIEWFVAKGSQLRLTIYEQPHLRPAVDIDAFIRRSTRNAVIELMMDNGFIASERPETLSHELKLTRLNSDVDLHWDLFRPGRARNGMMDWLFAHRIKYESFVGLDNTASLLVMLVHPVITKYLISPTSMLIHLVDQARLMAQGDVDWEDLVRALDATGTKTAAWASLYLLEKLGGVEAPGELEAQVRPGRFQASYLKNWIDRDLIERWFAHRWLVAGFFSLALQDTAGDALQALRTLRQVRNHSGLDVSGIPQ